MIDLISSVAGGCQHYHCPNCQSDFCRMCPEFLYSPNGHRVSKSINERNPINIGTLSNVQIMIAN